MEQITPVKHWSATLRINHWLMALAIFALIGTGFLIAYPVTVATGETWKKFSVGTIRYLHILFGVILVFTFIQRIYIAFFSTFKADWRDFLAWTNIPCTIDQIKFYLLIKKTPPSHTECYGPMQSVAYLGLMGMVFLIVLTGLILMGANYHAGLTGWIYAIVRPFEGLMGGLAGVRYIHHVLTWGFVLFIVVHVYMAFWYDFVLKEGTLSSMVSGYMYPKGDH